MYTSCNMYLVVGECERFAPFTVGKSLMHTGGISQVFPFAFLGSITDHASLTKISCLASTTLQCSSFVCFPQ